MPLMDRAEFGREWELGGETQHALQPNKVSIPHSTQPSLGLQEILTSTSPVPLLKRREKVPQCCQPASLTPGAS